MTHDEIEPDGHLYSDHYLSFRSFGADHVVDLNHIRTIHCHRFDQESGGFLEFKRGGIYEGFGKSFFLPVEVDQTYTYQGRQLTLTPDQLRTILVTARITDDMN